MVPADYFSREAEENLLLAMLEGDPRDVMLLTGPPSSGKTATIARVLQRREERKEVSKVTRFLVLEPWCESIFQPSRALTELAYRMNPMGTSFDEGSHEAKAHDRFALSRFSSFRFAVIMLVMCFLLSNFDLLIHFEFEVSQMIIP